MRDALLALRDLLDQMGIRWALIGGVAANLYRRKTRMTADVDLLLAADASERLTELEASLVARGWSVLRGDPGGDLLRLRHGTFGSVDLQIAGTEYQRRAIERARPASLGHSLEVPALSPEDVIVHKLIAERAKDIDDIEALLEARISFDEAYVEYWAEFWGRTDLWQRIRSGSTHSP